MAIGNNSFGSSRWTVLGIVLLASLPLALIFLSNFSFTHISQEFVVYRIGDALSLMFGEWPRGGRSQAFEMKIYKYLQ